MVPWVRLKQLDIGQTWTTNDEQFIVFDDVCFSTVPDGTVYFDVASQNPGDNSIVKPLQPGIYQMTFMADFDTAPTTGCELIFNKLNWDDDDRQYSLWIAGSDTTPAADGIPINSCDTGYGEVMVRADHLDAVNVNMTFFVSMNTYASAMSLFALTPPPTGGSTYWEVRYWPSESPFGLLNDFECSSP